MQGLPTDPALTKVTPRLPTGSTGVGRFGGSQFFKLLLASSDIVTFLCVTTASSIFLLHHDMMDPLQRASLEHFSAIAFLLFIVLHSLAKTYEPTVSSNVTAFRFIGIPTLLAAAALGGAFILEFYIIGVTTPPADTTAVPELLLGLIGIPTWAVTVQRTLLRIYLNSLVAAGQLSTTVAIIGAGDIGHRLVELLKSRYIDQIKLVGVFDDRIRRPSQFLDVQGGVGDLVEHVKSHHVDKILIALPLSAENRILDILHKLKTVPIDIALVPDLAGLQLGNHGIIKKALPFLDVIHRPLSLWSRVVKRTMDIAFSAIILLLFSPVMLLAALAIRLDSPGPIFFRQPRLGLSNEKIEILKFRTMHVADSDLEARQQTKRDDPRVTRIGKWLRLTSIDELPQLFNVLRGSMSLVGPRPHAIGMRVKDSLCQEISKEYAERHRVKPGITGWAQVCGLRGAVEDPAILRARIEHDIYYIDNWSFLFDLKILFMTVIVVLRTRNAY